MAGALLFWGVGLTVWEISAMKQDRKFPHPLLSAAMFEADGEGGDRHHGVHEAVLLRGGPPGDPIRAE